MQLDGHNVEFETPLNGRSDAFESRQSQDQIIGDASEAFLIDLPPARRAEVALSHTERGLVQYRNRTGKV